MSEKKIYVSTYLSLENVGRRALKMQNDFEFGGIFRQGNIQAGNAFTVIAASLSPYFVNATDEIKNEINKILGDFSFLENRNILTEAEYAEGITRAVKILKKFLDSNKQ